MSTIKISELGNLASAVGNILVPMVANVSGTLTTVKGNIDQVKTYVLGTLETDLANTDANVSSLQSDLTTAQADIIALQAADAGDQANVELVQSDLANVQSDLGTAQTDISTLQSDLGNITNGTATFGNLIPGANVTYSLGSPDAQWKDLYLSGSTIYIGGASLSVAGGEIQSSLPIAADVSATNITIQGTRIDFASGGYIEEIEVVDEFQNPLGYYSVSLNSSDDGIIGINALDSNAAVTSSVFVTNVAVQLNVANITPGESAYIWYFDNAGGVLFPNGTYQTTAWTGMIDAASVNGLSTVGLSNNYNDLTNLPNLAAVNDFVMGNTTHWTTNIYTITDAINQLAERIYNIENP